MNIFKTENDAARNAATGFLIFYFLQAVAFAVRDVEALPQGTPMWLAVSLDSMFTLIVLGAGLYSVLAKRFFHFLITVLLTSLTADAVVVWIRTNPRALMEIFFDLIGLGALALSQDRYTMVTRLRPASPIDEAKPERDIERRAA